MTNAASWLSCQHEHNVCDHTTRSMGDGAEFEAGVEQILNEAAKPGIVASNINKTEYKETK